MRVRKVYDLYEWLPPHGESSAAFHIAGSDVYINITYEDDIDGKINIMQRSIIFYHAVDFVWTIFPGARDFSEKVSIDWELLGSMVEVVDSKLAREFKTHLNNIFTFRHFALFLLSENMRGEVIAESFSVTEPYCL